MAFVLGAMVPEKQIIYNSGVDMKKTYLRHWLIGSVFSSVSLVLVPPAAAQTAPTSSAQLQTLGVITVTARKKAENLQKVPLSVTAIPKKVLTQSHVENLMDIAKLTPGLTIQDIGAETGTAITIRGVTDETFGANIPDAAVFLDDAYLRDPAAINVAAAPLTDVEVLKGPVSALYGRDAYSGVINYVTQRPTDTPHGAIDETAGDYGKEQLQGYASGPLYGDKVLGEVFGTFDTFNGTFHDPVSGQNGGGHNKKDIGALLDFNWNENFQTHIDLYYGYDFFNEPATEAVTPNCGDDITFTGVNLGDTLYCGRVHPNGTVQINNDTKDGAQGNARRTFYGSMNNTYSDWWGKVTAVTGATQIDESAFQDFDAASLGRPYLLITGSSPSAPPNGQSLNEAENYGAGSNTGNFSQEIRYTTPQDYWLRAGLGGYLYTERRVITSGAGLTDANLPAGDGLYSYYGGFGLPLSLFESPTGALNQNVNLSHQYTNERAEFGNVEADIIPNVTVSSQYRYTTINQKFLSVKVDDEPGVIDPSGGDITTGEQYFNTNEAIKWQVTPSDMVYFAFANGEKPGGFNGASSVKADEAFGPETDINFEGGFKTSFLNNRLRLDAAAYHIETANIQIYAPSSDPTNPATLLKNFGQTTNTGFEVDAAAKADSATTLTLGVSYNNPTFNPGSYDLADSSYCALIGPSCTSKEITLPSGLKEIPIAGNSIPFAPKVTLSGTAEYDFTVMNDYNGYARMNASFQTSEYTDPAELTSLGDSVNLDIDAGITRGPYSLSAYVKNLTNNDTPVDFDYQVQLEYFQNVPVVILPPGRTFAFELGYHF
jgi:iron complex outermembrane receptor protein